MTGCGPARSDTLFALATPPATVRVDTAHSASTDVPTDKLIQAAVDKYYGTITAVVQENDKKIEAEFEIGRAHV